MAVLSETEGTAAAADGADVVRRRTRVVLRLWGFTRADVARAEQAARELPRTAFWEFAEVIPTAGGVCPIPSGDPIAVDQAADYDWAWAVYLAGPDAG